MDGARSAAFIGDVPGIGSPRRSPWSDEELTRVARAEADYFSSVGADAVVTGFQLTTLLSSRLARIPTITSHAGSYVPPVFDAGLLPRQRLTGPAFIRFAPNRLNRILANGGPERYKGHIGGFNRVAKSLGVEGVPSLAAMLCGDLTLVTEAPEVLGLDADRILAWRPRSGRVRPGTRMRAVGPLFAQLSLHQPDPVREFLEGPGPVAYVALTSTPPSLVREAVRAVRAAGLRALVVSTQHELDDLTGERVMVVPFLPSHQVMPHVDVAVIAGGQGSVQTALASGVPIAGVPLQPEQEWNLRVAEMAGAARLIGQKELPRRLPGAIRDLLRDGRAKANAERVAAIYGRYDGARNAAEAILAYLGAPARAGVASD